MKRSLILGLVVGVGLGIVSSAQTLRGSWNTTIGVIVGPPMVLTIDSDLIVTYSLGAWSFTSDTVVDETGWISQGLAVGGALGAFAIGSALTFDPAPVPAFTSWKVTGGLSLAGIVFQGMFNLTPGVTTLDLIGKGTAGLATVTIDVALGDGLGCNLNFGGVDITVDFPFCCADVVSTFSFTCTGLQEATFGVNGIALPGLPWVTLNALTTFDLAGKVLGITPKFQFSRGCFDLYISADAQGGTFPEDPVLSFGVLEVSGMGLFCKIGAVSFTGVSYWGSGSKPSILAGTPYWEAYQIATTDNGCCGPFSFDITVYFLENGTLLFDIAELDANTSIKISTQFRLSTGIDIVLDPVPAFSWTIGFLVGW